MRGDFPDNAHLNNTHADDVYSANQIRELKSASAFQNFWRQDYFRATAPLTFKGIEFSIPLTFRIEISIPL